MCQQRADVRAAIITKQVGRGELKWDMSDVKADVKTMTEVKKDKEACSPVSGMLLMVSQPALLYSQLACWDLSENKAFWKLVLKLMAYKQHRHSSLFTVRLAWQDQQLDDSEPSRGTGAGPWKGRQKEGQTYTVRWKKCACNIVKDWVTSAPLLRVSIINVSILFHAQFGIHENNNLLLIKSVSHY